jgi:hypothetical protein
MYSQTIVQNMTTLIHFIPRAIPYGGSIISSTCQQEPGWAVYQMGFNQRITEENISVVDCSMAIAVEVQGALLLC